jgi:hypothetical protein
MDKNNNTLAFIQLVKCIIEYYGTTKVEKGVIDEVSKEIEEMDEAEKFLNGITDFNLEQMSIDIPKEINEEVKKTFLFELRKYREELEEQE